MTPICPKCGSAHTERIKGRRGWMRCLRLSCFHEDKRDKFMTGGPGSYRSPNQHWRDPVAMSMDGYEGGQRLMNQLLHRSAASSARSHHNLSHAVQHGGQGSHDAGCHDVIVAAIDGSLARVTSQPPVAVSHVLHGGKTADIDIRHNDRFGKHFDRKHGTSPAGIDLAPTGIASRSRMIGANHNVRVVHGSTSASLNFHEDSNSPVFPPVPLAKAGTVTPPAVPATPIHVRAS